MRELHSDEVQEVSGGYGTLGPGGGSDPGNRLTDYGVNPGGLRYTSTETRANTLGTFGALAGGWTGAAAIITSIWMR